MRSSDNCLEAISPMSRVFTAPFRGEDRGKMVSFSLLLISLVTRLFYSFPRFQVS